ncbi:MAG: hypothetical protein V2I37_11500 [Marinilabiliaceae bacterium]|jgi:hypothetical protein|nr:hypothetical protein [Marinilabiliaceae bacterium]
MSHRIVFKVLAIICMLCLATCTKDERQMLVKTGSLSNILTTSAYASGEILDLGEGVSQHGHCWSTSPNTSIDDAKSTLGVPPGIGGFTSELAGLQPGTTYFVKAYCSRGSTTVYGNEINFTTASADLAELTTSEISGITKTAAVSGGNITNQGGTPVTARGVCWSTASNPTVDGSKTTNGNGTGTFVSNISSLTAGTTYYLKAYAINAGGIAYGNELSFTTDSDTPVPPTVTTAGVTSVNTNSASCGGEVTDEGSESVTARGVCWSKSPNPTIANNTTNDGSGAGAFTSSITGLDPGTKYYVRAYATSSAGTSYGNEDDFTTSAVLPELSTLDINSITFNSAKSGGNITSNGGADITARGVCWNTSPQPTIANSKTSEGTGAGSFESTISGLEPGTPYYVRAYATNSVGTAYGNELDFLTNDSPPTAVATAATSVSNISATLNGSVNAFGNSTAVEFEYGLSTLYGSVVTASPATVSGSSATPVTAVLSGLSAGTTYHFRIKAVNSGGTSYSNDVSLPTTQVPSATTGSATSVAIETATINGTANAAGLTTNVSFEYGPTAAYGSTIQASPNPVSGTSNTSVSAQLSNLSAGTIYHYRLKVTSAGGTDYGEDRTFETELCPSSLSVTHSYGDVAPATRSLTYEVIESSISGEPKCWIARNLGASNQATSSTDNTEAAGGWYWQFNKKQGYRHNGTAYFPAVTWITSIDESSNWEAVNYPCALLLGTGWRIPTGTEWFNVYYGLGWSSREDAYNSVLVLHPAGSLSYLDGSLLNRGWVGNYYSSTQTSNTTATALNIYTSVSTYMAGKAGACTLRCIKD